MQEPSRNQVGSAAAAGWKKPLPEHLPRPTYWPAMLAFGITLALLGPVTSMAVTAAGVGLAAVSLAGWIGEITRE